MSWKGSISGFLFRPSDTVVGEELRTTERLAGMELGPFISAAGKARSEL